VRAALLPLLLTAACRSRDNARLAVTRLEAKQLEHAGRNGSVTFVLMDPAEKGTPRVCTHGAPRAARLPRDGQDVFEQVARIMQGAARFQFRLAHAVSAGKLNARVPSVNRNLMAQVGVTSPPVVVRFSEADELTTYNGPWETVRPLAAAARPAVR
jgi:hypothetical protein